MSPKTIIAIAGAGDLAKYVVDEAIANKDVQVVVLSRGKKAWFENRSPDVSIHATDYTVASVRDILDSTGATALFSLIHSFDPEVYFGAHRAMLEATKQSKICKRYSPSYFAGNIDDFPGYPRVYEPVHQAFHDEILKTAGEIEWTVINQGWFMDYVALFGAQDEYGSKSYMRAQQGIWGIDMKNWKISIPGTGDEPAAFTSARDVAKSIVRLGVTSETWEKHTYPLGEQITWNKLSEKMERFYKRKFVERKYRSLAEIQAELATPAGEAGMSDLALRQIDEWTALGGQGLPLDVVERQRQKFFGGVHFRTVDEVLEISKTETI